MQFSALNTIAFVDVPQAANQGAILHFQKYESDTQ
jgi:hypothetical protein